MEFIIFMAGLLVCSILIVLILHVRKMRDINRYTDRWRDHVYDESDEKLKKRKW